MYHNCFASRWGSIRGWVPGAPRALHPVLTRLGASHVSSSSLSLRSVPQVRHLGPKEHALQGRVPAALLPEGILIDAPVGGRRPPHLAGNDLEAASSPAPAATSTRCLQHAMLQGPLGAGWRGRCPTGPGHRRCFWPATFQARQGILWTRGWWGGGSRQARGEDRLALGPSGHRSNGPVTGAGRAAQLPCPCASCTGWGWGSSLRASTSKKWLLPQWGTSSIEKPAVCKAQPCSQPRAQLKQESALRRPSSEQDEWRAGPQP